MKKHNILKVILCVVALVTLCTWIFPTISFQSGLVEDVRVQLGIFDIVSYIVEIFRFFPYIILMTLVIGMFYGVAYRIPAYRILLDKIVAGFKGKESIFLGLIISLIAIIVSVSGLSFAMLFVFPFVISIVLLMGYNKLVAASVTVGSVAVGLLGTTLGSNTTYYMNSILSTEVFSEIITKIILLIIGVALLIFNVLYYAKKTKNNVDKVVEFVPNSKTDSVVVEKEVKEEVKVEKNKKSSNKKEDSKKSTDTKKKEKSNKTSKTKKENSTKSTKTTKSAKSSKSTKTTKTKAYDLKSKNEVKVVSKSKKKVHIWPFALVFDLVLIILVVGAFDWANVFDVDWFSTILKAVQDYTVFDFPIFAKILGNVNEFGSWGLNYEMPTLIFLATCFLAFIYGLKFDDFLDGITEGAKRAFKPAIYMFLTYLVLIIVTYNPFQLHFTKFLVNLTDGLNVITMTFVAMLASIFNIESIYVAQSTLPYVTSVITDTTLYPLISVIFQAVYGLMMLVAPTSVILLGTLTYLDVSYTQWIKHIWKLFLELLLVLVIIFFILFLI